MTKKFRLPQSLLERAKVTLKEAQRTTDEVRGAVEQAKGDTAKGLNVDLEGWQATLLNCENIEARAEAEVIRLAAEEQERATRERAVADVVEIFSHLSQQHKPIPRKHNRDNNLDVRIQYHTPDQYWVAVLMRDGVEWFIGGSLVGFGDTRGHAVDELVETARHLVIYGDNFLTKEQIPLADRCWLFAKLDFGEGTQEMYDALRQAGAADADLH